MKATIKELVGLTQEIIDLWYEASITRMACSPIEMARRKRGFEEYLLTLARQLEETRGDITPMSLQSNFQDGPPLTIESTGVNPLLICPKCGTAHTFRINAVPTPHPPTID